VATGSTELRTRDLAKAALSVEEMETTVRKSVRGSVAGMSCLGEVGGLNVYNIRTEEPRFMGLMKTRRSQFRVVDREGIIRLQISNGDALINSKRAMGASLREFIEKHTDYGDAGRSIPDFFILFRGRILDLTGLLNSSHIISLANVELQNVGEDEMVAALVNIIG